MNNQTNQPKISLWKCECTNCGDARSIKITQGSTPRYCSQCGSETNYQEVAENETGENQKTPQEIHQEELVKLCSPIIEFLKKQPHPYHVVLIKEEGVELLETKQYIPQF